jgi:hypothetical protein
MYFTWDIGLNVIKLRGLRNLLVQNVLSAILFGVGWGYLTFGFSMLNVFLREGKLITKIILLDMKTN